MSEDELVKEQVEFMTTGKTGAQRDRETVDAICGGALILVVIALLIQGIRGKLRNPFKQRRAWEQP